jgi:hypothetical protein
MVGRGAKFMVYVNKGHFDPIDDNLLVSVYQMPESEAVRYVRSIGLEAEVTYQSAWSASYMGKVMYTSHQQVDGMEIDGKHFIDRGATITLVVGS